MKVTDVTYISSTPGDDPRGKKRRERMELKDQEDDEGSIQLYTDVALDDIVTGSRKFTFNIYLEGIVKSYQIQRWDYLCKQLWSNRFGTDFEFIAEGKRFPVHKFVLEMTNKTKMEDNKAGCVQLFTASLKAMVSGNCNFHF